jgi:hypothetical protein
MQQASSAIKIIAITLPCRGKKMALTLLGAGSTKKRHPDKILFFVL